MVITTKTLAAGTKVDVFTRGAGGGKLSSVVSEVVEDGASPGWGLVDIGGTPVLVPVMDREKEKVGGVDMDLRGFEVEGVGRVLCVLADAKPE